MSAVTFQCDQCNRTTYEADPFTTKPSHWVRVDSRDFCSTMCATKFWAEPLKNSIRAAQDWLDRAVKQLDYCPDAPSGDRMDVQMSSRAGGHISEALHILNAAVAKAGMKPPRAAKQEGGDE